MKILFVITIIFFSATLSSCSNPKTEQAQPPKVKDYVYEREPDDAADHFVEYVKDDRKVFHQNNIVKGADAKTFKVVSGQQWDAEDKNYKYAMGRRKE